MTREEVWNAFVAKQKKKTFAACRAWRKLFDNPKVPWAHVSKALRHWWELHKELNLITERDPLTLWEEELQ